MPSEKPQEHWIKGLSSVLWPVFAFVVLIAFWSPLHTIATRLPDVIDKSQTISIAGLKLELDSTFRFRKPSPPVAEALKELYAEDVKILISNPDSALFSPPERVAEYREKYAHLIQLKLALESETIMLGQGGEAARKGTVFKLSPVGVAAKAYLVDLVVSSLIGVGAKTGEKAP